MDGLLEIELVDEIREVVGVCVHVVAGPRLARTSMATAVMGNAAVSVSGQEEHLVFPGIRAQRPAVAEDDRLSCAPVLVIDLGTVFRCDRAHGAFSFCFRLAPCPPLLAHGAVRAGLAANKQYSCQKAEKKWPAVAGAVAVRG